MAALFISHSSTDDVLASLLEAWLRANGFDDTFVDHQHLAGGAKWREELRASAGTCRVVVCIVTENWLASNECFSEFRAAWYMGKRIIPLFLAPSDADLGDEARRKLAEVRAEDQGVDLRPCLQADGGLDVDADRSVAERLRMGLRAAGALSRVGFDPTAFEINPKLRQRPFPGLVSFGDEDADAALFYGRSREIAEVLEELRKMRAERDLRPFVILGASGAGKSSLLKAGVIPRLRREAPAWLPLRAFRPGADPLLNFAEALARTLADFGKLEAYGVIRDRLLAAWRGAAREGDALLETGRAAVAAALEDEGGRLRAAAGRPAATILVSIDQAEELARADGHSGDALADYLRVALATAAAPWQLAFTIRTDSFSELQNHRRFHDLKARGYDLRAIPVFRFDSLVEEPAKRYGVEVDPTLVDALMEDAPKEDALPLLAFALQRLWRQYAASGALIRDNYHKVGGLKALIEDAAERALRGLAPEEDAALPAAPPAKQRVDLAASTFVPALAQLNDHGATIRRIATWSSFNDEQQDLLLRFDSWRLVVRKGDAEGGTVEVAHEALFREWERLKGWLEPERARLEALLSLQTDALSWDRNGRDAAFLNHRDRRLAEAAALTKIDSYSKRLGDAERDYLAACRTAEARARRRARRGQALVFGSMSLTIVGLLCVIYQAFLVALWNWWTVERPYARVNVWPYELTAAAERALKPGAQFRECAEHCPDMVVAPAGAFLEGSPAGEAGRSADEGPRRLVKIAYRFAVAKDDVTFDDWQACVAGGGCHGYRPSDLGWGRANMPVINVSWDDAEDYVAWLSAVTGETYRLPSEAEWEYAARAGSITPYYWGETVGVGNADCNGCGGGEVGLRTAPVGSFKPNAFGLDDMAGDVWEWVQDCYAASYRGAPADGTPLLDSACSEYVVRGGSWYVGPAMVRAAARTSVAPAGRGRDLGFRVARTLSQ